MSDTLLFVYNADSGLFNTLADMAHKTFSPETYSCNLCAITYGAFGMRTEWKAFLETLAAPLEFLHRDEFRRCYPDRQAQLPAIFRRSEEDLHEVVSAERINACSTMEELQRLILEGMQ